MAFLTCNKLFNMKEKKNLKIDNCVVTRTEMETISMWNILLSWQQVYITRQADE